MIGETSEMKMGVVEDELDATVVAALGGLSMRAGALDRECVPKELPAYVGDYLLSVYGDDETGLQKAANALLHSRLVARGVAPGWEGDVVCRVFGSKRIDGDVYALTTPCSLLHRMGIEGDAVRAEGLLDGSWCHLVVSKQYLDDCIIVDAFDEDGSEVGYMLNYSIDYLHMVRGEATSVGRLLDLRSRISVDEWVLLLLRSYGLGGEGLDAKDRLRLLSRFAPLVQPGLRALLIYDDIRKGVCEMSPYEVPADKLQADYDGFPGSWDCVIMGGEGKKGAYAVSSLLDTYEGIASGVSVAAVFDGGYTNLRRAVRLCGPFHLVARIPYYLTLVWETRGSHLGVDRCALGELWHALRGQELPRECEEAIGDVPGLSVMESETARVALGGIAKVLYPCGGITEEECRELLELVMEGMSLQGGWDVGDL